MGCGGQPSLVATCAALFNSQTSATSNFWRRVMGCDAQPSLVAACAVLFNSQTSTTSNFWRRVMGRDGQPSLVAACAVLFSFQLYGSHATAGGVPACTASCTSGT